MTLPHKLYAAPRTVRPLVIGVDFDGTVVEFDFPNIGRVRPRALETLRSCVERGALLILWTARRGQHREAAIAFLQSHGVKIHEAADGKPHCDVFIDDLALGIPVDADGLVDWTQIAPMLDRIFEGLT